jgi:hypothetical protein
VETFEGGSVIEETLPPPPQKRTHYINQDGEVKPLLPITRRTVDLAFGVSPETKPVEAKRRFINDVVQWPGVYETIPPQPEAARRLAERFERAAFAAARRKGDSTSAQIARDYCAWADWYWSVAGTPAHEVERFRNDLEARAERHRAAREEMRRQRIAARRTRLTRELAALEASL